MNRDLWTQPFAEVPTPTEFASYLRQRGWRLAASGDRWTSFERGVAGALPMGIDLPLRSRAGDYPAAARTVLENLARLANSVTSSRSCATSRQSRRTWCVCVSTAH